MKPFYPVFLAAIGLIQMQGRAEELPASAAPTNGVVITSDFISRLMNEAQTNNPGQLAAAARVKAAAANVGSIRVWDDPMFMIGGTTFSPDGMNPAMMGDLSYGIQQKLPLWGMPKLNRQVASAEMSMRGAQADYHLERLRRDLTQALFSAALAEQVVDIDEQDLLWLQTTAQAVEAKYRAGQADAGDTLQIQNEVALRKDQLQTDRLELSHDQFVLNRLLNRKTDLPWPPLQLPSIAPPVPYSAELLVQALTNEPELKIADQEIQRAAAAAKLARRTRLPDVSVGIEGRQYSGDGGFRSGMFTLSFSLPWGNAGKYRKDYERAKENETAAEQDREDQMLTVREELDRLTVDLDSERRQALLYQNEISIRAAQALADKLAGWQAGHVALQDVLDARRDALDAQLMASRATTTQYQTLAELLLWTGQENFKSLTSLADEPAMPAANENAEK
ncbi:MAG TPA: TolC family protein [Verrucomicrobiae bacterium]|nr:TolC family protein [Verrucomicrobiae bacterium]